MPFDIDGAPFTKPTVAPKSPAWTPARGTLEPNYSDQARQEDFPAFPSPAPIGDQLNLTTVRDRIFTHEVAISNLMLQEEQRLANLLNEQLTYLEGVARTRRNTLEVALGRVSAQRGGLPGIIEYQSIDYSYLKQIEGQEQRVEALLNSLDAFVANVRRRSNHLLAQVNAKALAGSTAINDRIDSLRAILGEISGSPLTKDLLASRLR